MPCRWSTMNDRTQHDWDRRYEKGWQGGEDKLFDTFVETYSGKLGKRVLDIGCGNGRHVVPLAQAGYEVTGIELSDVGVRQAKEALEQAGVVAGIAQGEARSLPFRDESFDWAISIQVFQFNDWAGAEQSFAEVGRVLKPGGYFFLRVKSTSADVPEDNRLIEGAHGATYTTSDGNTVHFYTLEELQQLGAHSALTIEGEPVDTSGDGTGHGHWNVVFRKTVNEEGESLDG